MFRSKSGALCPTLDSAVLSGRVPTNAGRRAFEGASSPEHGSDRGPSSRLEGRRAPAATRGVARSPRRTRPRRQRSASGAVEGRQRFGDAAQPSVDRAKSRLPVAGERRPEAVVWCSTSKEAGSAPDARPCPKVEMPRGSAAARDPGARDLELPPRVGGGEHRVDQLPARNRDAGNCDVFPREALGRGRTRIERGLYPRRRSSSRSARAPPSGREVSSVQRRRCRSGYRRLVPGDQEELSLSERSKERSRSRASVLVSRSPASSAAARALTRSSRASARRARTSLRM